MGFLGMQMQVIWVGVILSTTMAAAAMAFPLPVWDSRIITTTNYVQVDTLEINFLFSP